MNLILNLGEESKEKIAACIKDIGESVSENDVIEIVLKPSMPKQRETTAEIGDFLLKGKARTECKKLCEVFDDFITGPGLEGREIKELTESYQEFYRTMQTVGLNIQEEKKLENAIAGVAIESEMQGFIYGFRMYEEIMMRRIPVMQEATV